MRLVRRIIAAPGVWSAHRDPLVSTASFVALLVASNQPFYPLYLWWLVSADIGPAFYTFFSTPFFLAVPLLARRNTLLARALLPLAGIGNTVLCAKLFGTQSAVEIFLIPCVVLALLLFRPGERIVGFAIVALACACYLFLGRYYGAPVVSYDAAEYAALVRLNAASATALTACVALIFSNLLASAEAAGGKKPG